MDGTGQECISLIMGAEHERVWLDDDVSKARVHNRVESSGCVVVVHWLVINVN